MNNNDNIINDIKLCGRDFIKHYRLDDNLKIHKYIT